MKLMKSQILAGVGASVVLVALVGCQRLPQEYPVELDESAVSDASIEDSYSPTMAPFELPPEVYVGDETVSGFPVALIDSVLSQYNGLADSVVLPFGEFSTGSGWVYDSNHVVTNWHVVDGMGAVVTMETRSGDILEGTVIATEEFDDIAVVRLSEPTTLTPLEINIDSVVSGHPVFFIGHPGAIGDWVTGVGTVDSVDEYSGFVYTSMPLGQGASGSPMFNMEGQVVALNSGCMDFVENRYRGDDTRVFSYIPPKANCGGTQSSRVVEFVENAIG